MEVSPFSAKIHLKNSAIKDKNGNQINIPPEIHVSQTKEGKIKYAWDILHLENANITLQNHLDDSLSDCDKMHQTNSHLENAIEGLHSKLTASDHKIVELSKDAIMQEVLEIDYKNSNKKLLI